MEGKPTRFLFIIITFTLASATPQEQTLLAAAEPLVAVAQFYSWIKYPRIGLKKTFDLEV